MTCNLACCCWAEGKVLWASDAERAPASGGSPVAGSHITGSPAHSALFKFLRAASRCPKERETSRRLSQSLPTVPSRSANRRRPEVERGGGSGEGEAPPGGEGERRQARRRHHHYHKMAAGSGSAAAVAAVAGGGPAGPHAAGVTAGAVTTGSGAPVPGPGAVLIGDRLYSGVLITLENCLLPEHTLRFTPSMSSGLDPDTETELRVTGCELIQAAGILLRLPQVGRGLGLGGARRPRGGPAGVGGWSGAPWGSERLRAAPLGSRLGPGAAAGSADVREGGDAVGLC